MPPKRAKPDAPIKPKGIAIGKLTRKPIIKPLKAAFLNLPFNNFKLAERPKAPLMFLCKQYQEVKEE